MCYLTTVVLFHRTLPSQCLRKKFVNQEKTRLSIPKSVYVHQRKPRTNRVIRQVLDNVTLVIISCLVSLPMFVIIKPLNTVTVVFVRLLEECL